MRTILIVIVAVASVSLFTLPLAAQGPDPAFVRQLALPGANETKFPRIASDGTAVHIAAPVDREAAAYWSVGADSFSVSPAERLGVAEGQPDYSSAAIAAAPDGTMHYVWVNQPERTIYLRTRNPGQAWGPTRVVARGQVFPVLPVLAASSSSDLLVAWRNPDAPFVVRHSTDGGATWGPALPLSRSAGFNAPAVAASAPGRYMIAFTEGMADRLQIMAAEVVNGSVTPATRVTPLSGDFADPGVAWLNAMTPIVSWRGIADTGGHSGVFFAERQLDGSWPVARLAGGPVTGKVAVVAESNGSAHIFWIASPGGGAGLWYARRPAGGQWSPPVLAPPLQNGMLFNADGAVSGSYAYGVNEVFLGSRVTASLARFSTALATTPSGVPRMGGEEQIATGDAVTVRFEQVRNAPTEVRWSWGRPPVADTPWKPYEPTLSIPLPEGLGVARCEAIPLYTQLRSSGGVQTPPGFLGITIDRGVQADVRDLPPPGALPGYTRLPTITLAIDSTDCSGLSSVDYAGQTRPLDAEGGQISLTLPESTGVYTGEVAVTDRLGYRRPFPWRVIYDTTAPAVGITAPASWRADARATILTALTIPGVRYQDAGAPAPASIQLDILPPEAQRPVTLTIALDEARVSLAEGLFTLAVPVNLAQAVPQEQLIPGTYALTGHVLDAAGNPGTTSFEARLELSQVTYLRLALPLLRR